MEDDRSGRGQYDLEYEACPCFWGRDPAKFVRLFDELYLGPGITNALDIGAGEGKNSLFLAEKGLEVTAIEVSRFACRNFINRMIEDGTVSEVTLINADACKLENLLSSKFDVVVSYGFLHCLRDELEAGLSVKQMQDFTKAGGFNVVSAFTNEIPVPAVQSYLSPTLLRGEQVREWYEGWNILEYEEDVITESHPTSLEEHNHSLFRMIAKKL